MRISTMLWSAGLLILSATEAMAQTSGGAMAMARDPFANFYGNTMESKHQDGQVFRAYFNRDHTYKVLDKDGKVVRDGTYTYKDKKLCFWKDGKSIECPPFNTNLKLNETWDAGSEGKHVYLTLKPGR